MRRTARTPAAGPCRHGTVSLRGPRPTPVTSAVVLVRVGQRHLSGSVIQCPPAPSELSKTSTVASTAAGSNISADDSS